jgi:hypothetical protein
MGKRERSRCASAAVFKIALGETGLISRGAGSGEGDEEGIPASLECLILLFLPLLGRGWPQILQFVPLQDLPITERPNKPIKQRN